MNPKIKLTNSFLAKIVTFFLLFALVVLLVLSAFELAFLYEFVFELDSDPTQYKYSTVYHLGTWSGLQDDAARDLFNTAISFKSFAIPNTILLVVAALACIIFLIRAAGHKGETDEIFLNYFDRIPFDLYAGAILFAAWMLCWFGFESFYYGDLVQSIMGVSALIIAGMLAFTVILSFATRVKYGKWLPNTIIYMLCKRLIRYLHVIFGWVRSVMLWFANLIKAMSHSIPIVWRTMIIVGATLFTLFIFSIDMFYGNGFQVFVYFLIMAFIFLGSCFGALQMKRLKKTAQELAAGNIEYKLDTSKMYWEFKSHGDNLNSIGDGMAKAVEQRMKSERLKTELITNVSHDIKTPLTSIINYVDFLQKEHTEEDQQEYLAVLDRQSHRLKKLIEDLVEASKASTGNMPVALVPTNTLEIINQSMAEYATKLDASHLSVIINSPEPPLSVMADGRLLWRVIDNLINNVCKYGMTGTRVYVDLKKQDKSVVISIKNISNAALNVNADELIERFIRGDASRNTEGSGLGLNIAKSLVEIQKGEFRLSTDGDLFKAEIILPQA